MTDLYLFREIAARPWFGPLARLDGALAEQAGDGARRAYHALHGCLLQEGVSELGQAMAEALLWSDSVLAQCVMRGEVVPAGVQQAARFDLATLARLAVRDWRDEASAAAGLRLPPLRQLAGRSPQAAAAELLDPLAAGDTTELYRRLIERYRSHGAGPLARFVAYRWDGEALQGIEHPAVATLQQLVDVSDQIETLRANTERFLAGKPAHHTLLYGPRGSGKSTAIRGLMGAYAERGVRLVELPLTRLADLPQVVELVRPRPHRYLLFVDDLSFEQNGSYAPLKTLLEGSLTLRPDNILVYATSNRRHLVKERFSDRPDPLDEEVHAWDSQHEKLALADRFGLTITFPDATQRRYLLIVGTLAAQEGLFTSDLEQRAIRFADWGNGYSGRTARQFVDSLKAELA